MRSSFIPTVLIVLVLALVFLLPGREGVVPGDGAYLLPGSGTAGSDVATALLDLARLELLEPPHWVRQRGSDEVLRNLDRLAWGSHGALLASRNALLQHRGGLAQEVLSRLDALGESDPIQASKLVAVLGQEPPDTPGVVEELLRRALSESDYLAKAALRVLREHPAPEALAGILARRNDESMDVRAAARTALCVRVVGGDEEARLYLLEDVENNAAGPDLDYVEALAGVSPDERVLAVLGQVEARAPHRERMAAFTALVRHGDAAATARLEDMIVSGDLVTRVGALDIASTTGRVLAREAWAPAVQRRIRQEVLLVMVQLARAIRTGDEQAPRAWELLEQMAFDSMHPCQTEALDELFGLGHAWAIERTRSELQHAIGAYLNVAVDRVVSRGDLEVDDFVELALQRLADPEVADADRVLLHRLVAYRAPERGLDGLVHETLDASPVLGRHLLPLLPLAGFAALERLSRELDGDRGAGLFVVVAAQLRRSEALPHLEAIAVDRERDLSIRQGALDAIVRLQDGRREDALRRIAQASEEAEVTKRAYLLFWNYL